MAFGFYVYKLQVVGKKCKSLFHMALLKQSNPNYTGKTYPLILIVVNFGILFLRIRVELEKQK